MYITCSLRVYAFRVAGVCVRIVHTQMYSTYTNVYIRISYIHADLRFSQQVHSVFATKKVIFLTQREVCSVKTFALRLIRSHTHTHMHTHAHACTHARMHAPLSISLARARSLALSHTYTLTHSLIHTHTHTHIGERISGDYPLPAHELNHELQVCVFCREDQHGSCRCVCVCICLSVCVCVYGCVCVYSFVFTIVFSLIHTYTRCVHVCRYV